METKDMVCIVCPLGCKLKVMKSDEGQNGYTVEGNKCFRGMNYGITEMTNPTRVLTTTVVITGSLIRRLPVKTSGPIPKHLIEEAMKVINKVEVKTPIKVGQTVINNILGTGVDVISSRSMYANLEEDYSKDHVAQG